MAAALHRSTTVTPEMLAAAHLDQPQTLTIPHTAYAAVNSVSTYRAQYPTRQPTIPLHTAFNRSVSDTDTSWAKKQKARVLAEFQITGEVDKSEVLEGYAGAKGILQPNGWLEVLHGSTDSSISLRPESFLGATIWCEISYHDFRAMSLNSIAQGMVEQIADPDLPVAVAQARLAIGVRRVAEARKALATSARLLKELWAAALTMQRDPYAGSKMEPGLSSVGLVSGPEIDAYGSTIRELGDAVPDHQVRYGEYTRVQKRKFWIARFWDIVVEFLKPSHGITNIVEMLENTDEETFICDGLANYLVDGWDIVVSQFAMKEEMSRSDDQTTRAMWDERLKQGTMNALTTCAKHTFYRKVDHFNYNVADNVHAISKTFQQRLDDLPVYACCLDGTAAKKGKVPST